MAGRNKGTGPICRNGPEGASHKLGLSPFSGTSLFSFSRIQDLLLDTFATIPRIGTMRAARALASPILAARMPSDLSMPQKQPYIGGIVVL